MFSNDTWPEAYRGNGSLNSISYTSLPPMNYSIMCTSGSRISLSTGENGHAAAATSQRGHLSVYTIFINRLIGNLFSKRLCTRNNPFNVTQLVFLGPPQRGFRCLRRKRKKKQITENRYRWLPTYPPITATRLSCSVITA